MSAYVLCHWAGEYVRLTPTLAGFSATTTTDLQRATLFEGALSSDQRHALFRANLHKHTDAVPVEVVRTVNLKE